MPKKIWTTADIPSQIGKIVLVTGATAGLGYETALALAQAGATVILAGRNEEKGKMVIEKIRTIIPDAKLEFGKIDQSSLSSVREFADTVVEKYQCLDILVNNAGVMNPPKMETTVDGFELQFATNYLSHFCLTCLLMPLLQKSSSPRVVHVSSLAHRQGKINFDDLQYKKSPYTRKVYSQSKLANLLFAIELQRRSEANKWGVMSNSAHPGLARTDLLEGNPGITKWLTTHIAFPLLTHSAVAGALPTLYAATAPEAHGGAYYGPDGIYEMKGAVAPAYISPNAKDATVAAKLWDVSVGLTGVSWPAAA